jgi:hypothetical protein
MLVLLNEGRISVAGLENTSKLKRMKDATE